MTPPDAPAVKPQYAYNRPEMGAIAHLYRAEVYRSTIWRTRLDNTTNWSVVTVGIALTTTFSSREASPIPLLPVGLLLAVCLSLEARLYRYFNVWRARARWMAAYWYAPMVEGRSEEQDGRWQERLANDYLRPRHHISFARAAAPAQLYPVLRRAGACLSRQDRQAPVANLAELVDRAAVGPIPGWAFLVLGGISHAGWIGLTVTVIWLDRLKHRPRKAVSMG